MSALVIRRAPAFSNIRPTYLVRAFYASTRTPGQHSSLALKSDVKAREEESGKHIVGDTGKGVEGPHYEDLSGPSITAPLTGAWTLMNPIYTTAELDSVQVVHRTPVTFPDKLAHGAVRFFRRAFDVATGYKAVPIPKATLQLNPVPIKELRAKGLLLSPENWLRRIILLESIAGVPGMVAGTLRHLRSLRLLRRDGGWIHTLLEEVKSLFLYGVEQVLVAHRPIAQAENERMHLLTFMTVSQPSVATRALVLAAQGVFYNLFFLTYLITPRTAHRFVGALEEEAVRTYTHCIKDMETGLIPEWDHLPAPPIAIDYWRLPADAKIYDVIRAVRADEATHRFVNHTLADLDQKTDFNPFALGEAPAEIKWTKPGFSREESAVFARNAQQALMKRVNAVEQKTIGR